MLRRCNITFASIVRDLIAHPLLLSIPFEHVFATARNYNTVYFLCSLLIILLLLRGMNFSQRTDATNNNILILQYCGSAAVDVKNGDESQFLSHISLSHVARKIKRAIAKIVQREILSLQIAFSAFPGVLAYFFLFFLYKTR